jgi:hypothetical protein
MDRAVLVFGLVAVTALLAFSMTGRDGDGARGTTAQGEAGGAGVNGLAAQAAPERRVTSVGGRAAPEPPPESGATGPSYASPGYMDRYEPRYDNEQAILDAQTAQAVAALEAARASEAAAAEVGAAEGQPDSEGAAGDGAPGETGGSGTGGSGTDGS